MIGLALRNQRKIAGRFDHSVYQPSRTDPGSVHTLSFFFFFFFGCFPFSNGRSNPRQQ
jgi:hypothetical protein